MSCSVHATTRGLFLAQVVSNTMLCEGHYLLRLAVEGLPPSQPGQFVQLQCRNIAPQVSDTVVEWQPGTLPTLTQPELTHREPLLRRPISLAGRRAGADGMPQIDLIYRVAGVGTRWLTDLAGGETLSLMGPLGNAFAIRPDKKFAVCIGGGVGIPPMIYLAEALAAAGRQTTAFCGIRSVAMRPFTLMPDVRIPPAPVPAACVAEFARHGVAAVIASDDGSLGAKGFVSAAFEQWFQTAAIDPRQLVVYCCGPEPLMQAVAKTCLQRDIECQLALERHMACGIGTCQSCVVKIRDAGEQGWSYKLCCTDGPVFDARTVLW